MTMLAIIITSTAIKSAINLLALVINKPFSHALIIVLMTVRRRLSLVQFSIVLLHQKWTIPLNRNSPEVIPEVNLLISSK